MDRKKEEKNEGKEGGLGRASRREDYRGRIRGRKDKGGGRIME